MAPNSGFPCEALPPLSSTTLLHHNLQNSLRQNLGHLHPAWIALPGTTGISRTCYYSLLRASVCGVLCGLQPTLTSTDRWKKSEREPGKPLPTVEKTHTHFFPRFTFSFSRKNKCAPLSKHAEKPKNATKANAIEEATITCRRLF